MIHYLTSYFDIPFHTIFDSTKGPIIHVDVGNES